MELRLPHLQSSQVVEVVAGAAHLPSPLLEGLTAKHFPRMLPLLKD